MSAVFVSACVCTGHCCHKRATIIYSPSYLEPLVKVPGDQLALETQWCCCGDKLLQLTDKCYKQTGAQELCWGPSRDPGPLYKDKNKPGLRVHNTPLMTRPPGPRAGRYHRWIMTERTTIQRPDQDQNQNQTKDQ